MQEDILHSLYILQIFRVPAQPDIATFQPNPHSYFTASTPHIWPSQALPFPPNHPTTMSSVKPKKVHYERGTKGENAEKPHRSRDSGIGSSSASDRASLGTSPNEHFDAAQIKSQRNILSAVQEALDSANERIKQLEAAYAKLNKEFMESNKENRLLKKEKKDLMDKVQNLEDDLYDEKKKNRRLSRENSPKSKEAREKDAKAERRNSPPRIEYKHEDRSPLERRLSVREHMPPAAPQPPLDPHQNPFMPLHQRGSYVPPLVTYAPSRSAPISYTASSQSYAAAPVYAQSPVSSRHSPTSGRPYPPNDGRYHLTPI